MLHTAAVPSRTAPRHGSLVPFLGVAGLGALCAWLFEIGLRALLAVGGLRATLSLAESRMIGPAVLAVVAVLFLAERRWPAVPRPVASRAHLVDAIYVALFGLVVAPVLTLVEIGCANEIEWHAHFLVLARLPVLPRALAIVAIVVGMDAMNWLAHLANHRFVTLWRLHALHHSQEDMSVLTTFRTHPLVHSAYLIAMVPALVLGANGAVPGAILIVYGCLVVLPHANLDWRFGPFERVLVSPAYHRIHHARELSSRGAVNYGFVFTIWDQLAGRAVFPVRGALVDTGLARRSVPIEQTREGGVLGVVAAQLAQPFRRVAATDW